MNTEINNNLNITEGTSRLPNLQYSSPSVVSKKDEYKMINNELYKYYKKEEEITNGIKLIEEGKKSLDDFEDGVIKWIIERRLGGK